MLLPLRGFAAAGNLKETGWEISPDSLLEGCKLKHQKLGRASFMVVGLTSVLPPSTLPCSVWLNDHLLLPPGAFLSFQGTRSKIKLHGKHKSGLSQLLSTYLAA